MPHGFQFVLTLGRFVVEEGCRVFYIVPESETADGISLFRLRTRGNAT